MLSQSPRRTSGSESRAIAGSKNVCRTAVQPGRAGDRDDQQRAERPRVERGRDQHASGRVCRRRYGRSAASCDARGGTVDVRHASLQLGRARRLRRATVCSSFVERAVGAQRVDRLAHAGGQRAALVQHAARTARACRPAASCPTIFAVVELGGGHVERGRQVDHDAVDLAVLQRLLGVVVGVVDLRLGWSA